MTKLAFYQISDIDQLEQPEEHTQLDLNSPATLFFTDFQRVTPLVTEADMPAVQARELMRRTHVRMKLVVNRANQVIGLISADDLIDRLIVKKVSEGHKREEITVEQLMTPRKELQALDITAVNKASISDVIDILKDNGEQHCLVIDREKHHIRGVFSASDISRKLHLPIDIQEKSSFYRVFASALSA